MFNLKFDVKTMPEVQILAVPEGSKKYKKEIVVVQQVDPG